MEGKLWSFMNFFIILMEISLSASSVNCANFGNDTDRQALLAFKDKITEDPLGVMSSWNDSQHFCNWQGATCGRRHQRVVALDLNNQGLAGRISPYIGNLSFLRSITFQDNRFSGNIPEELSRLHRLQYLNLTHNILQGDLPGNWSHCLKLKVIDISFTGLQGKVPESFGSLSNLIFLSLFSNHLHSRIPPSVGNLSLIQYFSLGFNHLQGTIPDSICHFKNVKYFGIGMNNISGAVPSSLYNSSSLVALFLLGNQLTGSLPSDIGLRLPNLRAISVGHNTWNGKFPVSFANASHLEVLDIGNGSLRGPVPADLGTRMVNLSRLSLGFNNLGTEDGRGLSFLDSLSNCSKLQIFEIIGNNFSGVIPSSITNLSTELSLLAISGNRFTGNIPEGLSKYVQMFLLALDYNFLSGSIPSGIGKLQSLQGLVLSQNRLSDPIPTSIGNLTRLSQLSLDDNNLTGSIPSSFKSIQGLQMLNLSHNNLYGSVSNIIGSSSALISFSCAHNSFTGPLPSEIGGLDGVHDIDFSSNKFSGEIPSTLGNCLELEILYLDNNMLQGSIPSFLGSLKTIKFMDLSNNNLSGAIPDQLENLSLLEYLNLSFNSLQGEIPSKGIFMNATVVSIVGNKELCGGIQELHLPNCASKDKRRNHHSLLAIIVISIAVVGLILIILLFVWGKGKPRKTPPQTSFGKDFLRVSYNDLLKATEGFSPSNLIGVGSFGSVYKGILHPGESPVAIKVFNLEQVGATKSFIAECETLRKARHRNLVKVVTACSSTNFEGESFKALVFEFLTNGSLESWLHPSLVISQERQNLNLLRRLNIALDVASALKYLHQDCEEPIVHCDLKPSNVLLDQDMNARVGDFGLARFLALSFSSGSSMMPSQSAAVQGSIGYVAPEYGMGRDVSRQGDIYSYGILLLEMVTGKRPTDDMFRDGQSLHSYCKMALLEQELKILDVSLQLDEEPNEAKRRENHKFMKAETRECLLSLVELGVACSAERPEERIDAGNVLMELKRIKNCFLQVK